MHALAGQVPTLVVYCAGHDRPVGAKDFDLAEMQRHLAVNYSGALHLLQDLLLQMLAARAATLTTPAISARASESR